MRGEAQYRVHAYICGRTCVQHVEQMGTVPFSWVWQHRPGDCRYAVASEWRPNEVVIVWDLYQVQMLMPDLKPIAPEPITEYGDVDAAIMATAMTYGDGDEN